MDMTRGKCGCGCVCHTHESKPDWPGPCAACCEPDFDNDWNCACIRAIVREMTGPVVIGEAVPAEDL